MWTTCLRKNRVAPESRIVPYFSDFITFIVEKEVCHKSVYDYSTVFSHNVRFKDRKKTFPVDYSKIIQYINEHLINICKPNGTKVRLLM